MHLLVPLQHIVLTPLPQRTGFSRIPVTIAYMAGWAAFPPEFSHPIQPRLLWTPLSPAFTNVEVFRRAINRKHPELQLKSYSDLHAYSVSDYEFWQDLWQYLGIICSVPPANVIEIASPPERPLWFCGAALNYAENILRRNDDSIACTAVGELGISTDYSFKKLHVMVSEMAAALRAGGLAVGDRVAAVVTNSITAIVVALATASIGALYTSTAPDMGAKGILDRYRQIRPKIIFMETEFFYGGKVVSIISKAQQVVQDLSSYGLQLAIMLPSTYTGKEIVLENLSSSISLSGFLATGDGLPLSFAQLPFQHPLYILYSSGTSGAPKCIVHTAGGILLQTMKDFHFSFGVGTHDAVLQYTTTGWMMWNLMIAGLPLGARIVLYDGSPLYPSIVSFMRLIADQGVSVLGVSPRFLAELRERNIEPSKIASFEALRSIVSGGAVLAPALHQWAQETFGPQTRIMTAMGGTDICTAFLISVLSQPVYAGEIPCKALGMKVDVFDPNGHSIEHLGEAGEMVCTRPHPSIPLRFWDDASGKRLQNTYYGRYPGVWRQSDFMAVNPVTKGIVLLGRSDGVLNPNGIRFGSGEIYSVLERFSSDIEDTVCVGQRRPEDINERVLLFVKMHRGKHLTPSLAGHIRYAIQESLSRRHLPEYILEVQDIPYTTNGKKVEILVKQIVSGTKVQPSGAIANPGALEEYYKYVKIEDTVQGVTPRTKL